MTLRLVSYNIRFGGGRRRELIADVLRSLEPDVVVLQEATDTRVLDWLAEAIGFPLSFGRPGWSVAALSREPLQTAQWHISRRGRAVLELRLQDRDVRIFGVHLSAGLSGRGERLRAIETGRLLELVARGEGGARTLIVGDFNAIAPGDGPRVARMPLWLRLLLRFDGGIRTQVMSTLLEAGFVDGFRRLHPAAAGFTLPPVDPSVRLDYLLLGPALVDLLRECGPGQLDGPAGVMARASDHLPLVATLDV